MILVFGKKGQAARELGKFDGTILLDREQANLIDLETCKQAITNYKPKAVINAAAYTSVDKAEKEEALASIINGEAPGVMARVCAKLKIPLVHISTDYVFDGSGETPWQTFDKPNPKNSYGRSKFRGEEAIKSSGCIYAILRTSWVVSAHGSNFVKTMLSVSEKSDCVNVVNDQIGGPTCAKDIAKACISIANQLINNPNKSGIYHLSGKPDVSWCQFANAIFELAGRATIANPILTSEYPTLAVRPLNSRLNFGLTEKTFQFSRPKWRDGLEDILRDLEIIHD
jgi:dTDP-4-dehydrorhamnose reductase